MASNEKDEKEVLKIKDWKKRKNIFQSLMDGWDSLKNSIAKTGSTRSDETEKK
jgi:hypothetical protein